MSGGFAECRHDIEIKRLANGSGLLRSVEDGDALRGIGEGGEESGGIKRTIQADLHETDAFAICN